MARVLGCWGGRESWGRAVRWPPGGVGVGVGGDERAAGWRCRGRRGCSGADAKDANKRRPCQGKRCTTVGVDGVERRGRCSCKRLSARKARAAWLSRAPALQASFVENVSIRAAASPPTACPPAAPRSLPRPTPHTMAMRLAVSRPLAAAARSTAARAFSTTALRAKEIAGENTETPNMRVGAGSGRLRGPPG